MRISANMAKSAIAEAWLASISAHKTENKSQEKDNSTGKPDVRSKELAKSEEVIPVKELSENSSSVPKLENDSIENAIKKAPNSVAQAWLKSTNDNKPKKDTHETSSKKGSSHLALENESLEIALRKERSALAQAYLLSINDNKQGSLEEECGETVLARRLTERKRLLFSQQVSSRSKIARSSDDNINVSKKDVIALYKELEEFLKSESFEEDIKKELEKSNPDYLKILEKRRNDMEKPDHSIVVAGEVSSGKSTLINKIIGREIFKGRNEESTATLCKLRNSGSLKIVLEHESGKPDEVRDSPVNYNPDSKEGLKKLRNTLKPLTDKSKSKKSMHYRSVDIGFPIPFLKDGHILVDTPGIGGSGEVIEKLIEYIPNAVTFIFVVNVASAGGMQRDRLPVILREITLKQIRNEMPCFDPKNVLFITNKWDLLNKESKKKTDDSSDDEEDKMTWKNILSDIKEQWPSVKEDHIFKMNLYEVALGNKNSSMTQFEKFMETLKSNIEKGENTRVIQHFRYLQEILRNITKGLQARIHLNKRSEEEQQVLVEEQEKKLKTLDNECKEVRDTLRKKVSIHIEATAQTLYDYMSTDIGKEEILNPKGKTPILDVMYVPGLYCNNTKKRICRYVKTFLKKDAVKKGFEEIKDETIAFSEVVGFEIFKMEKGWVDDKKNEVQAQVFQPVEDEQSSGSFWGWFFATSVIWIPLLAAGFGLFVAFAGVTLALTPVIAPIGAFLGRDARKKKLVDETYEKCKSTVRSTICNQLESNAGVVLLELIDKMTLNSLPRRIQCLHEMICQLQRSRNDILAKRSQLLRLECSIQTMENHARAIQKKNTETK